MWYYYQAFGAGVFLDGKYNNMHVNQEASEVVWKESIWVWLLFGVMVALLGMASIDALKEMVRFWEVREEYGHGYLIPFITAFLIWQKKDQLERVAFQGAWSGLAVIGLGVILILLGNLSTITVIAQYGFVVALMGIVLSYVGLQHIRLIFIPLVFLLFMIPLPGFVLNNLSSQLQLISSELGVFVIRLFDISVFLEGNVIDLGTFKLQVVEACSGLNYLFPLMTLAFMACYFYQAVFWKRAFIFLSSIPVTIFMNSFRIGIIGVLVEYGGPEQAEGFLHDFEGWIIFMLCILILVAEMWLLNRIGNESRPLREVFGLEFPEPLPKDVKIHYRAIPRPYIGSIFLLLGAVSVSFMIADRQEIIPQRVAFSELPLSIGDWQGKPDRIEQVFLDVLKLDDYALIDYVNKDGKRVNFYAAYYESQSAGESAHSPRSCIPGGGWRIKSHNSTSVNMVNNAGQPLQVNRLVIQKGDYSQLVYYWFQQRGRIITNEYLVKWYLFADAVTRSRSDGAMIRLTTVSEPGEDLADADERIQGFLKKINPMLNEYIPE